MKQFTVPLIENRELAPDYHELAFSWPAGVRLPLPGQFLTLQVDSRPSPFLRRPYALSGYDPDTHLAKILVQSRGPASRLLTELPAGHFVDILGPRGFPFQVPHPLPGGRPLLVAGGIGTGPLLFAAQYLVARGHRPLLVLGFRHRALAPRISALPGVDLAWCSDDGSLGVKGTVVTVLDSLDPLDFWGVWTCGPQAMLRSVWDWARPRNLATQVLIEEVMACGVGACMGCTVATTDERQVVRVCTEGPVFPAEVLQW